MHRPARTDRRRRAPAPSCSCGYTGADQHAQTTRCGPVAPAPSADGLREAAKRAVNAFCAAIEKHVEDCECAACKEANDAFYALAVAATSALPAPQEAKGESAGTPNALTLKAMAETERGDVIGPFSTVEELVAELDKPEAAPIPRSDGLRAEVEKLCEAWVKTRKTTRLRCAGELRALLRASPASDEAVVEKVAKDLCQWTGWPEGCNDPLGVTSCRNEARRILAIVQAPAKPEEWKGPVRCEKCHTTFGEPGMGATWPMSTVRVHGETCGGRLLPYDRRKGGQMMSGPLDGPTGTI